MEWLWIKKHTRHEWRLVGIEALALEDVLRERQTRNECQRPHGTPDSVCYGNLVETKKKIAELAALGNISLSKRGWLAAAQLAHSDGLEVFCSYRLGTSNTKVAVGRLGLMKKGRSQHTHRWVDGANEHLHQDL